jgi:hypothetical protein
MRRLHGTIGTIAIIVSGTAAIATTTVTKSGH